MNAHLKKLAWRSRRGLLELELLLVPFVHDCYEGLPADAQRSYEVLLEHEDLDIYDWIQDRRSPADASLAAIVELIRGHNRGSKNRESKPGGDHH